MGRCPAILQCAAYGSRYKEPSRGSRLADTVFQSQAADSALVQSAKEGNRAAFGDLYGRYRRMVHGILLAHVSYADAEDLMQTVFM